MGTPGLTQTLSGPYYTKKKSKSVVSEKVFFTTTSLFFHHILYKKQKHFFDKNTFFVRIIGPYYTEKISKKTTEKQNCFPFFDHKCHFFSLLHGKKTQKWFFLAKNFSSKSVFMSLIKNTFRVNWTQKQNYFCKIVHSSFDCNFGFVYKWHDKRTNMFDWCLIKVRHDDDYYHNQVVQHCTFPLYSVQGLPGVDEHLHQHIL